ncbi:PREDICTED: putative F-box protein At5g62660 [Brassica oleracea var. oleracea]|uniref:putative F-box protein At5g62660 n=1 Tax=Brassica oleracea var. oleracea TaxID=109376 RepID=UPI0006A6FC61|nr:PREDICTED: putative F-box protein At5g62660 [Brassica oleracea var. oleracea]
MVKFLSLMSAIQWKKWLSKAMGRGRRHKLDCLVVAPEIPWNLMIEILTRLPAKSLMRFKCVSKTWSLLIRSRYFSNLYLTVASPRRPPCLYMSLMNHYMCDSIGVCQSPRESQLLSLSSSTSNSAESFDLDLTMQGMGGHDMVVLRGLILYIVCGKACIYNPTTRQSVTLPVRPVIKFSQKVKGCDESIIYYFGHDPVLDQYKILCIVSTLLTGINRLTSEHWVYVLESGGFWKRIGFDCQPHIPTIGRLCINGVIYYLAYASLSCYVLVSFDVRSEQFNMIQVPKELSGLIRDNPMGFIEYGGKPAIFDQTYLIQMGKVDLWVLEGGGAWSTKSLVLQPCEMHLLNESIKLLVRGTTQNDEVILAPCKLFSNYYLRKNDLRKVNVGLTSDHWFGKPYADYILFDKNESILHLNNIGPLVCVLPQCSNYLCFIQKINR